jgi:hypothetical protein
MPPFSVAAACEDPLVALYRKFHVTTERMPGYSLAWYTPFFRIVTMCRSGWLSAVGDKTAILSGGTTTLASGPFAKTPCATGSPS